MSVYRRAFLYVTRKKGKTGLLLLILTILMTLILMGTAINRTTAQASARLREELGGYFKIMPDYRKMSINQRVDQALVDRVMEINGIKAYNALDVHYLTVGELSLKPGRFTMEGDSKAQMARFLGNTSSELHEYFYLKLFSLAEGRHIEPGDRGKALLSKTIAEQNGLKVGDVFSARMTEETAGAETPGPDFYFDVIGIYDEGYQEGTNQNTPECDITSNFIFIDAAASQALKEQEYGSNSLAFRGGAVFFVKDPKKLDDIVADVEDLEGMDWESLRLTANNSAYQSCMEPLERLEGMTSLLVGVIVIIGVVLLSLLLMLWERDRIHEAGVLMSFGISKWNILWQHFLECMAVFLPAFCLALVISMSLSGWIGGWLYDGTVAREDDRQVQEYGMANEPISLKALEEQPAFEVKLSLSGAALSGGVGVLLIGICVGAAFLVIVRRKPRELLTIME